MVSLSEICSLLEDAETITIGTSEVIYTLKDRNDSEPNEWILQSLGDAVVDALSEPEYANYFLHIKTAPVRKAATI